MEEINTVQSGKRKIEPSSSSSSDSNIDSTKDGQQSVTGERSPESSLIVSNGHIINNNKESSNSESEKEMRDNSIRSPPNKRSKSQKDSVDNKTESESENNDSDSEEIEESKLSPPPAEEKRESRPKEDSIIDSIAIKNSPVKAERKKGNPFKRPSYNELKKTGESFVQGQSCKDAAPKLGKCRECKPTLEGKSKKNCCRFFAFRKLRYNYKGQLAVAGFSDPIKDPSKEEKDLWLPSNDNKSDLERLVAKRLLYQLGNQFCELIHQESEALEINESNDEKIAWKRVVSGAREMCDVCSTTLFNFHWTCGKCGFVVCIACYKTRKNSTPLTSSEPNQNKEKDEYQWLLCNNKQSHEINKMLLTQIIAGDSLVDVGILLHKMRDTWKIPQTCGCNEAKKYKSNSNSNDDVLMDYHPDKQEEKVQNDSKLTIENNDSGDDSSSDDDDEDNEANSTLRNLFRNTDADEQEEVKEEKNIKPDEKNILENPVEERTKNDEPKINNDNFSASDNKENLIVQNGKMKNVELKHFVRSGSAHGIRRDVLRPIRAFTLSESQLSFPDVSHTWLCCGKLLQLLDPVSETNYKLFQEVWSRGQPVIVSNVAIKLNSSLWTPESFKKDFGKVKNDLINCMTGKIVSNQPMDRFWEGFDNISKRLKDDKGVPMLLKLKDWPPGEDFADKLPNRFKDLMGALPLVEYTQRNGRLNLAARLPKSNFVKPDLGPKMYIAYGSGAHLDKGTTNLHLDISDAVNVMVHVGSIVDDKIHDNAVRKAIEESDCDAVMIDRTRRELPGALWHIYNARDADKIRDLLNKVAVERGEILERHHDPIHDQSWYLDQSLRKRLRQEYDVSGYPIIQYEGDAVFIPAGAPHQVRNLNNCIKIAEDFVSPDNVSHCFDLTEEFRKLSDKHSNHEDKLQIRNIIYFAMKDALSCLMEVPDYEIKKFDFSEDTVEDIEKT